MPHKTTPKGAHNPFGSTTGPFDTIGGWGKPANKGTDLCPKCGGKEFYYRPGFCEGAENVCPGWWL